MEPNGSAGKRSYAIQAYTLKDLAGIYKKSRYHMRKLLLKKKKAIGEREGYFYEEEQVKKIFELIELPSDVEIIK